MTSKLSDDYTIVPINLVDATKGNTDIVVHQSYIFQGTLSLEKLEASWNILVAAWPILWARIRKDDGSRSGLAYHIPTAKRQEEIRNEAKGSNDPKKHHFWSVDKSDKPFSCYFPGFKLPGSDRDPTYTVPSPSPKDFYEVARANSPTVFTEYLHGEFPLISIQVTLFSDATVITRSNSHVYGDGFTMAAVLRAWQDILNGKGPPAAIEDLGYDPFTDFAPSPEPVIPWKEEHRREPPPPPPPGWRILNWKEKINLLTRFLYDLYIARPESKMEHRYLFVSLEEVEKLQQQAKEDLESMQNNGSSKSQEIRIGKSDVLYAWLMKNNHVGLPESSMSTALSIINLKGKPPPGIILPKHNFFCSALPVPLFPLNIGDIQTMPLGELALHIRQSHQRYLDPEIQRASLRFHLHHVMWTKPSGAIPFFAPPNHRWSGLSDLRALRYFQLDFGGATLDEKKNSTLKAPLIAQHVDMSCAMSKRDRWLCLGDSPDGTWFSGFLSKEQWEDPRGFGRYEHRTH